MERIIFKASKGQLEDKWHCAYSHPSPEHPHTADMCRSPLPTAHSAIEPTVTPTLDANLFLAAQSQTS